MQPAVPARAVAAGEASSNGPAWWRWGAGLDDRPLGPLPARGRFGGHQAVPAHAILIPSTRGTEPQRSHVDGARVREALRDRTFWLLAGAFIAQAAAVADRYGVSRYAIIATPINLAKAFAPLVAAAVAPNPFLTAAGEPVTPARGGR